VRAAARGFGLAASLALVVACSPSSPTTTQRSLGGPKAGGQGGAKPGPSPQASLKPVVLGGGGPSPSTAPSPVALASQAPALAQALKLPLRVGLAFPASLVGAAGAARFSGQDGQVAPPGSEFYALADGSIISNNSGGLISDQGGGIVSNHSGSLISDQGGGLGPKPTGGYRLAAKVDRDIAATATVPTAIGDPRMRLWLILSMYDYVDQIMAAFLKAKPKLGRWKRFSTSDFDYLPLPRAIPGLESSSLSREVVRALRFAGHLSTGPEGTRLRLVHLPQAQSGIAEGLPVMDWQASGGVAVMHTRYVEALAATFGLRNSASRLERRQGPHGPSIDNVLAETGASDPGTSILGLFKASKIDVTRRHLRLEQVSPQQAYVLMATSERTYLPDAPSQLARRTLTIGYDPRAGTNQGLAILAREANFKKDPSGGLFWDLPYPGWALQPGALPLWPYFLLPTLNEYSQQAPAELQALVPPYRVPEDDALIPPDPAEGEDVASDAALSVPPLPEAVLLAPVDP
jgi:hypothetical protein